MKFELKVRNLFLLIWDFLSMGISFFLILFKQFSSLFSLFNKYAWESLIWWAQSVCLSKCQIGKVEKNDRGRRKKEIREIYVKSGIMKNVEIPLVCCEWRCDDARWLTQSGDTRKSAALDMDIEAVNTPEGRGTAIYISQYLNIWNTLCLRERANTYTHIGTDQRPPNAR